MMTLLKTWFNTKNKQEVKKRSLHLPTAYYLLLIILLTTSCTQNKVYEKHQKLENYSWNHFQKINFDFTIDQVNRDYDIFIAVRFIDGVPYQILKSAIQIKFPDGQERYNEYDLNIRNKDGSYKGSVAGDIWDCSIPVLSNYPLSQKGRYSVIIHNLMTKLETPGIMEIGLIIKKSEG
jgi:gliding motility-associated lipoprotein GldH